MAEVTSRKITEYRWFCVDKNRCEQLDEKIEQIVYHQSKLSSYVEHKEITGLQCLFLEGKFKLLLKELRAERASLWRRVRREIEERTETDEPVNNKPAPKPLMGIQHIGRLQREV